MIRSRLQCKHGINDSVDVTYRLVREDFRAGLKETVYGFWCYEHNRHGTWVTTEPTKKVTLKTEKAESE